MTTPNAARNPAAATISHANVRVSLADSESIFDDALSTAVFSRRGLNVRASSVASQEETFSLRVQLDLGLSAS
jgi:hypothetical protein